MNGAARARVSTRVGFDDAGDQGSDATFSMGLSRVIGLYASCGRIARARVEPGDAVPSRPVPSRPVPSRPVPSRDCLLFLDSDDVGVGTTPRLAR